LGAIEQVGEGREVVVKDDEDEWFERLQRLKLGEGSSRSVEKPEPSGVESTQMETATYPISDLDKRLARLEAALGSDETNVSPPFSLPRNKLIPRHPYSPF
jgi:hypothetical protein